MTTPVLTTPTTPTAAHSHSIPSPPALSAKSSRFSSSVEHRTRKRTSGLSTRLLDYQPLSRRLPSDLDLVPPTVASPSPTPPHPYLNAPPRSPLLEHQHEKETPSTVASLVVHADRAGAGVEGAQKDETSEGGSGDHLRERGAGASGRADYALPEFQEDQEEQVEEQESSSAAVTSLAHRQRDNKGKGKGRAVLGSIDNLHLPTRPLPPTALDPQSFTSALSPPLRPAARQPIAGAIPTGSFLSRSSHPTPTSTSSSPSTASNPSGAAPQYRKLLIADQPVEMVGQPPPRSIYVKIGHPDGLLGHLGSHRLVLNGTQVRQLQALVVANEQYASPEDWLRIQVVMREIPGTALGRRDHRSLRFECALCSFSGKRNKRGRKQSKKDGLTMPGMWK